MRRHAILKVGIYAVAFVLQAPAIAGPKDGKPWSKHCTFAGIPANPHGNGEFDLVMQAFVHECTPSQACVLSCIRSKCGDECFHTCRVGGEPGYGPPEVLADMYAAKDPRVCPAPPNNSRKRLLVNSTCMTLLP